MIYFWLLLFGIAIGIFSGLLGIGGGILLVPGLMLLFGFSQPEAQGTSLAVLIPPIGIFAALVYIQHGYVRLPVVTWVALGFAGGAFLGAKLVPHVTPEVLRIGFGGLLIYLGLTFVFTSGIPRPNTALPAALSAFVAWFVGRRGRMPSEPNRTSALPPGDDIEYRI